jgi:inner membrane protein
MLGRNHLVTSMAVAALLSQPQGVEAVEFFGGVAVGSLLPDIDHPRSLIGRVSFGVADLIHRVYGHRTVTHSLLAIMLLGITAYITGHWGNYFTRGLLMGYLLHLVGDYLTTQGVPWFWPYNKERDSIAGFTSLRISTGSPREVLITLVAACAAALVLFTRYI